MWDWLGWLQEELRAGRPVVLITVVRSSGSTPREPGARLVLRPDGSFRGTVGGGQLEELALQRGSALFETTKAELLELDLGPDAGQCCGGGMLLFLEYLRPGRRCLLLGADPVLDELALVLQETMLVPSRVSDGDLQDPNPTEFRLQEGDLAVVVEDPELTPAAVLALASRGVSSLVWVGTRERWNHLLAVLPAELGTIFEPLCEKEYTDPAVRPRERAIDLAAVLLQRHYRATV